MTFRLTWSSLTHTHTYTHKHLYTHKKEEYKNGSDSKSFACQILF